MSNHDASSPYPGKVAVSAPRAAKLLGLSLSTVQRRVNSRELPGERTSRPQGSAYLVWLDEALVNGAGEQESSAVDDQASTRPDASDPGTASSEQASGTPPGGVYRAPMTALELSSVEPLFSAIGDAWVRPILGQLRETQEQAIRRADALGEQRARAELLAVRVAEISVERDAYRADVRRLERELRDAQRSIEELTQQAIRAEMTASLGRDRWVDELVAEVERTVDGDATPAAPGSAWRSMLRFLGVVGG